MRHIDPFSQLLFRQTPNPKKKPARCPSSAFDVQRSMLLVVGYWMLNVPRSLLISCEVPKTLFNPDATCPSFLPVKAPRITSSASMN